MCSGEPCMYYSMASVTHLWYYMHNSKKLTAFWFFTVISENICSFTIRIYIYGLIISREKSKTKTECRFCRIKFTV